MVLQRVAAGVGVIAGPAGLVQPCCLTAQTMMAPVPSAVQQLAISQAGECEDQSVRDGRATLRDDVVQRLESLGLKCVRPRCGPFVWFDVSKFKMSGRAFCDRLAQAGVLLTPGDRCGPSGRNFVRMTWAGDEGRGREGMRRLEECTKNLVGWALPTKVPESESLEMDQAEAGLVGRAHPTKPNSIEQLHAMMPVVPASQVAIAADHGSSSRPENGDGGEQRGGQPEWIDGIHER
jgi:hypothetical protein